MHRPLWLAAVTSLLLGCGFPKTTSAPPVVSAEAIGASKTDPATIEAGRVTFTAKCNGCHGYPDVGAIDAAKWPAIMSEMAGKALLTKEQEAATLAFVLAARGAPAASKAP